MTTPGPTLRRLRPRRQTRAIRPRQRAEQHARPHPHYNWPCRGGGRGGLLRHPVAGRRVRRRGADCLAYQADYVLIPALILCLALVGFGLHRGRISDRSLRYRLHALGRTMILESVITCPHCATAKSETMPTDACRFFYTCTGCGATLRPKQGDCCVFCSYGSVPCPPIQAERSGGTGAASCCGG